MRKALVHLLLISSAVLSCTSSNTQTKKEASIQHEDSVLTIQDEVALLILGNVQDAGSPHIGCQKDCCTKLFEEDNHTRKVTALAWLML